MKVYKNRVAEVNAYLKAQGVEGRMYRGDGYYYFSAGLNWPSVYICHASAMSRQQWRAEINDRIGRDVDAGTRCAVCYGTDCPKDGCYDATLSTAAISRPMVEGGK